MKWKERKGPLKILEKVKNLQGWVPQGYSIRIEIILRSYEIMNFTK